MFFSLSLGNPGGVRRLANLCKWKCFQQKVMTFWRKLEVKTTIQIRKISFNSKKIYIYNFGRHSVVVRKKEMGNRFKKKKKNWFEAIIAHYRIIKFISWNCVLFPSNSSAFKDNFLKPYYEFFFYSLSTDSIFYFYFFQLFTLPRWIRTDRKYLRFFYCFPLYFLSIFFFLQFY